MSVAPERIAAAVAALRPAARKASANAHAPYSGFHVGAALRGPDGAVYAGCNVESASYGLTQCAERNALGAAISAGVKPGETSLLVIYLPGVEPLPPCGACRQWMVELLQPGALVVSCCDGEAMEAWQLSDLLPGPFLGP